VPLRYDAIYTYLLNYYHDYVNVYILHGMLWAYKNGILWHQKTRSRHSKCANIIPPT